MFDPLLCWSAYIFHLLDSEFLNKGAHWMNACISSSRLCISAGPYMGVVFQGVQPKPVDAFGVFNICFSHLLADNYSWD